MKPSHFIPYAERTLHRHLTYEELEALAWARHESVGKRDGVKAMRAALEGMLRRPL